MNPKALSQILTRLEHHIECWKQFNEYLILARDKRLTPEDESQFLELKCVLTQELEQIFAVIESGPVSRDEVHALLRAVPSLRSVSELDPTNQRAIEDHWHKLFINWQVILGQLKAQYQAAANVSVFSRLFRKSGQTPATPPAVDK